MPSLTGIFQEPGQAAALLASQIQDAFSCPPARFAVFYPNCECLGSGLSFLSSNKHNETLILVGIAGEQKQ